MDHIKLDQVVVIPDTPDRSATKNTTAQNSLEKQNSSFRLGQGNLFPEERKNYVNSSDKVQIHPPRSFKCSGKPGHHGNSMASNFGESSSRDSLISRRKADRILVCDNKNPGHPVNAHNRKPLFNSQSSAGRDSAILELSDKQHAPKLKRAFPAGGPGLTQAELADSRSSSYGRVNLPLILKEPNNGRQLQNVDKVDSTVGCVERTDNSNDPQLNAQKSESAILNSNSIPRNTRQKRLVRNGCISPMNIAKGKQPVEKDNSGPTGMRQSGSVVGASGASTSLIAVRDIVVEDYNSDSVKGKGLLHHTFSKNVTSPPKSTRNSLSINEKADEYGDAHNGGGESGGWRTTHTESRNLNPPVSHQGEHISIEDGGSCFISHRNGNKVKRRENLENTITIHENSNSQMPDASATFGKTKGGYMAKNTLAKRQKRGSSSSTNAECSTSAANDSGSVILIDEATPKVQHSHPRDHGSNADSTASQVELDEILARELQEQFYNENPAFGSEEIDAHIALALQQEESHSPVSRRRQPVSNPQIDARIALALQQGEEPHLSVPRRRQPVANPNGRSRPNLPRAGARATSSNRVARLRNRFPGPARTISSSRGRNSTISPARQGNSLFPRDMDVDMRMHILETLESFAHMEAGSTFLHLQRDFNENDYEMLLALDENNHQHAGTTARRINDLPQSTVQTENLEETCAICLENPTMGDIIRHLPCFHKFHKDCIDPWLGRSTSCPVCKSSIT